MGSETQKQALETAFARTQILFARNFGIDLIADSYSSQDACAIVSKNQLHQPSACIELDRSAVSYPSACIELSGQ
jgi:hypothetical protein